MPDIPPLLLQSAGSLAAILVLVWLARAIGLGGEPVLASEQDVADAADEVESGFDPVRIAIARGGSAALAEDDRGRIVLIKRHGNRFAGRVLTGAASAREDGDALVVDCADPRFAAQRLSLQDAQYWADAINRL